MILTDCLETKSADKTLLTFLVPAVSTHLCKCRGMLLHLIKQRDTHIYFSGLPWTNDRPLAEASTYTTPNTRKEKAFIPSRDSNSQFQQASGPRHTP
jgi:hypothetical protein